MSIFNPVQSFVDMTKSWQQSMKDKANKANTNQMMANAQGMFQAWLSSNNQTVKNNYMSGSNLNTLAWAIVTYAEWKWKYEDYANLQPAEVIDLFLKRNEWRGYEEYINQYTGWKIWLEQATKLIWINQNDVNPYVFSQDIEDADFDPSLLTNFEYDDDLGDIEYTSEYTETPKKDSKVWANIVQSVLDVPLNIGKLPFNLIDKWTAWVAKQFSNDDEAIDEQLQENLQKSEDALTLPWVNREDLSYQIPNVVTDLWVTALTSFIPWVWEAKWAEWAAKYPKLAKLIKSAWSVEKLAEKYPKLAPYLKGWELWVKDTVTMNALEWEWTTPLEALEWWLAWWIVERWLKGLKWLSTFLETNWLFTKSKANQIIKKLKDIDSAPWKWTVDDLADFMTKHGLTWSKKNIVSKAEQLGVEKKKILDELLAQSPSTHSMDEADEALELLMKRLSEWAENAPMIPREKEIMELNELIGKSWKYTLSDLEKIKMKIDEHLKLYNKNWTPTDNESAKWWRATRKKIQHYIEDVAKKEDLWNVAMLNNEIQTSYAIADWIANRNALDTINNYIGEYWLYWAFWIPVIKDIINWDYSSALKDGGMAFLFWSSWFKTHLWSMLNRMSGTNRYEVDQWIASEWKNKLSESASQEVADILNRDTSFKEWIKQYITNFVKESSIVGGQKWTEVVVDELKN